MDTPVKSVPSASTSSPNPVSQFEDSPIFKYINNLSPLKPLNSEQTFNLLSFTSPKTSITSPGINSPPKSKIACSSGLSYPVKPEPADGENELRKTQVTENSIQPVELVAGKEDYLNSIFGVKSNASAGMSISTVDACQSTGDERGISLIESDGKQDNPDLGIIVKVVSIPDEPAESAIEPHQCVSRDHGCCDSKADDKTKSVPQTIDSERSSEIFIQGDSVNVDSSFNSNLAMQGVQFDQMEEVGCRWENMFVEATDHLFCDSPLIEEGDPEKTGNIYVDSGTFSFMENVLQPSEENIDGILNIESTPLGSFEENNVEVSFTHPNEAEHHSEVGQASIYDPIADKSAPNSHAEVYNKACTEQQQMLPRRCLVFEVSGTQYRKLISEVGEASLISEQSACTSVTSEKRLVSSQCEVFNCSSLLPGIGLHLNTLARREKIVVKQEISTYKRQLISIPCTTSSLVSTSSDPKPIDSLSDVKPLQKDLEPSSDKGKSKENASQSWAVTGSEKLKQNLTKKKRCKSENVEVDTCKRCNCKRSKCLKLYCECFAAGLYCVDPCACQGCLNKPAFEETVMETRRLIESRNPLAFAPKVITFPDASEHADELNKTPASARHKRGCNCKKSGCLKKYCECYQGGVGCSLGCRCEGCRNTFGRKKGLNSTLLEVTEATEDSADEDFPDAVLNVDTDAQESQPQVTPSSQFGSSKPSGFAGFDLHFSSFSSGLIQPCINQGHTKSNYFSCNDTLGVPILSNMPIKNETTKALKEENDALTSSTSVKSVSPNSKRILPNFGPRHSPPKKFCRKLILRSIPSLPKFPDNRENGTSQQKP